MKKCTWLQVSLITAFAALASTGCKLDQLHLTEPRVQTSLSLSSSTPLPAPGAGQGDTSGGSLASSVAAKLGRKSFLIGMGNDLNNDHSKDGAYTLGTTLDIHYAYLVGLQGQGGWTDWNANGTFVDLVANAAISKSVIPMFTLYSMAAWGEANSAVLVNDVYMGPYWSGAKLLFQRLGSLNVPTIVNFEPDWWAYAQHTSADPSKQAVHVKALAADCGTLPDTTVGMGQCLVLLARKYAPKAIVGFHASEWADPEPAKIASYLVQIGADRADFLSTDALDRDAGCFEAGIDPNCQRGGAFYLDETNKTSPNFHEHLSWVKALTQGTGKPMLWWQVPFGVPSNIPGGSAGRYRDNRVKYIFEHIDEYIAAGGLGAVFGAGAGNQTVPDTIGGLDGGQFKSAVSRYYAAPHPL